MIKTDEGLDFDLLSLRIHPAASRVAMLAEETPAAFVAFDLLADGNDDLRELPFGAASGEARGACSAPSVPRSTSRRSRRDPERAHRWFDTFEGAGLDGVVAKDVNGEYREGERGWLKVKHLRTADCVVAGFRTHKDGKGVGSLLLGLYNDEASSSTSASLRASTRRAARSWSRSSRRTAPTAEGPSLGRVGRRGRPRGRRPDAGPGARAAGTRRRT